MGTTVLVASILDEGHVFHENRIPAEGRSERRGKGDGSSQLSSSSFVSAMLLYPKMNKMLTILLFLFIEVHS